MKFAVCSLLILLSTLCTAQDTIYARKVINELCSRRYAGRAYVANGEKKAAAYIASEFKKAGLSKIGKSYFQEFPMSVNTFPKTVVVKYNGKVLQAGVDYLVDPSAPSCSFKGEISFVSVDELDSATHYDEFGYNLKAAVLDTFTERYFEEAAISFKKYSTDQRKQIVIRLSNSKLTWSSSGRMAKVCLITLRNEVFERGKPAFFEVEIKNKFLAPYMARNVIGMIEGNKFKDSFIVLTAHYDHLGMMGKTAMFPGANDNASGIAMMLNLARYFKANPQPFSIVFIAFSGEENGLVGSHYFVQNPLITLSDIRFLVNIDLMGNGSEGVMAVNGIVHSSEFNLLKSINTRNQYLPDVKARGKAANSDHYWFSHAGVSAFFFYLMGPYPYYHDVNDKASAVPLSNFSNAFLLFRDFIVSLQKQSR